MKYILVGTLFYSVITQASYFKGVLFTDRCRIRQSTISDTNKVYKFLTDHQVAQFQYGPELKPREIDYLLKTLKNKMFFYMLYSNLFSYPIFGYGKRWIIEDKKTDEFMGIIAFSPADRNNYDLPPGKQYINTTIALQPAVWGNGYCSEIASALKKKIDGTNNTVYLITVNPKNERCKKVAEKLEFEDQGIHRVNGNRIIHRSYDVHLFVKENKTKSKNVITLDLND